MRSAATSPLLLDPAAHRLAVKALADPFRESPPDQVLGIESRGFIFGSTLALELDAGFVLARKPGKLPAETDVHPGHTIPTTVGQEWETNPFVRLWRGLDAPGTSRCTSSCQFTSTVIVSSGASFWVEEGISRAFHRQRRRIRRSAAAS